jgi:hypothetical protein
MAVMAFRNSTTCVFARSGKPNDFLDVDLSFRIDSADDRLSAIDHVEQQLRWKPISASMKRRYVASDLSNQRVSKKLRLSAISAYEILENAEFHFRRSSARIKRYMVWT